MNRRSFLNKAGTVSVLVVGGVVYRAYDSGAFQIGQSPAFAPWRTWRSDAPRGPLRLVQAAIIAANPHNTQPWLFRVREATIDVFADRSRHLGTMDPYSREMHIGLGCAIENLVIAGRVDGYDCQVTLADGELTIRPPGKEQAVATIELMPRAGRAVNDMALYQAIPHRHTDRAAYDTTRPMAPHLLAQLSEIGQSPDAKLVLLTTQADKEAFAQQTLQATKYIVADKTMAADSHRWFRGTTREMEHYRDGVTLEGVGLSPFLLRVAKMLPASSAESAHRIWIEKTRDVQLATASLYGLLTVNDLYDQAANVQAGRLWQRLHLWATTQGLSAQPLNQLMERVDRERQRGQPPQTTAFLTGLGQQPDRQTTFAFRMGYPTQTALPVVRRALDDVLR